jgi:hypothetical protein
MSEDYRLERTQKKEEERKITPDFCGSLGKGMLAKEKKETLGNSSGLTPIRFDVTGIINNTTGLSPLRLSGEIYSINKKSGSLIEDLSGSSGKGMLEKENMETLRDSSGLTPLNFDSELQIKAPGVTPLQSIRVKNHDATETPEITSAFCEFHKDRGSK